MELWYIYMALPHRDTTVRERGTTTQHRELNNSYA
jgi:hypothetical protein